MKRRSEKFQLRVDPIKCDGYGHCAELAPELVALDEWGYPFVATTTFQAGDDEYRSALLAVKGCPRQALWLEPAGPAS